MLVSIIIPSAGRRPELLKRAIKSALIDDKEVKTEIIVVLNGKDGIAFNLDDAFQHSLVNYYKIKEGNVSKARNFGLSLAKGELIRFLDDDDFLYPDIAHQQYAELYNSIADMSYFSVAIEDEIQRYQILNPSLPVDYCAATLSSQLIGLPLMSVYKSYLIKDVLWDENLNIVEDEKWMRTIATKKEVSWIRSDKVVGCWYQHHHERLSYSAGYASHDLCKNRYQSIKETLDKILAENRGNSIRVSSAMSGIWSCIHGAFYLAPVYWTKAAKYARKIDPSAKPNDSFFYKMPSWLNPIIIEWLMLPKRWLNHCYKVFKFKVGINSHVRKI